jgi:hypothetical protein
MIVTWSGWCSLEIPEGWVHEDRPDIVSIFREPDGVGALQLSFAKRTRPQPPTPEAAAAIARSFAAQRGWGLRDEAIRLTVVEGAPCAEFDHLESNGEGTYWQVWHLLDSTRLAFVTYVCEPEDASVEQSERNAIVTSLRWI